MPRHRNDIFLPVYKPRNATGMAAAIEAGYLALPPMCDEEVEDKSFRILLDVFRNKQGAGGEFRAIKPTVDEILADPKNLTYRLLSYDRDYPGYDYDEVIDCIHPVPELEALMRQAMILHNQYRWDPATSASVEVGKLQDEDYVVAFHPRNSDVTQFIRG
jgi:3-oxoacyl-[acyl-carrier-protein] synthase III